MIIYESCYPVFGKQSTEQSDSEQKRELIGSVWIFEDVTEERKSQQTIRFLAERDSLTGLLNRRSLTESLTNQLAAEPNTSFAAIYVDLDNFKIINDVHGHARGDDVLAKIAQRLTSMTRTSDLVARMGGDEFLIVVRDIDSADLANWCDRLLLQLSAGTLVAQDSAANVTCSIGVALAPRDADNAEALIAAADQAMYDAKRAGKNAWRPFLKHTERDAEKRQTLLWADRINNALRTDGFTVFLQGVHYAHNAEVHHWEALVRMPDPSAVGQFFSPGLFIGNAEKSGKIIDLDRWMIRRCAQILSENPHIEPIAVNMSALSLSDPSLPEFLKEVLHAYNIPGSRMHLELTETAALSDLQGARVAVSAIQSLGCHICLDDFGAGFASLSYLKHIEANYVKIDGMFIQNLQTDRENQVLLRAIIDIAHHSHRLTVAEWIENAETLQRVQAFGIDLVQGFHLSKPLPAEQVTAARRAHKQLSH
jgi:diguanylate cyclase (GGDEF)-like protein